jgi:hypothetical protein
MLPHLHPQPHKTILFFPPRCVSAIGAQMWYKIHPIFYLRLIFSPFWRSCPQLYVTCVCRGLQLLALPFHLPLLAINQTQLFILSCLDSTLSQNSTLSCGLKFGIRFSKYCQLRCHSILQKDGLQILPSSFNAFHSYLWGVNSPTYM